MDTGTHLNDLVETASSVALRQKASDEGDVLATFVHANFGNTGRLAREILAKLGWLWGDDGLSPARRLDNVLRRLKKAGKVQYLGQRIGWVEVPEGLRVAESYASCCSRQRVMRSGAPMRRSTSIKP